jgi:hypothetical protein
MVRFVMVNGRFGKILLTHMWGTINKKEAETIIEYAIQVI